MKNLLKFFLLFTTTICFAQGDIATALEKINKKTVPYITVDELKVKKYYQLLDAREPNEYEVSHIENAVFVGFLTFDPGTIEMLVPDKNETLVIYCSIGVRSEMIGEKLQKLGYYNVYNLYGGIFQWKNSGGKVVDSKNHVTDKVHTYNKEWSAYLHEGTKVYED